LTVVDFVGFERRVRVAESVRRAADLAEHCLRELGRYKSPRYLRFVADLPKGPSGKVQRMKLADGFVA
jgi:long-chain acyl-CoA synthetase